MRRHFALTVLSALLIGCFQHAHAQDSTQTLLIGTWRHKGFAYTFFADGRYVFVGSMGGEMMRTSTSESGTYAFSGDKLIVRRQRGVITTSMNYRQELEPETTVYSLRMGNTPNGLAFQLIFPSGQYDIWYKD